MAASSINKKDHWSSEAYSSAAGFVPKLTTTVVSYLDPQANDTILDIGCGDGELTAQIAKSAGRVLGVDASKSFISSAKEKHGALSNCSFILNDSTQLQSCPEALTGKWDKAFSNAAMHWILREPSTRAAFFENVHKALKPGGKFVFEMGGKGNVAEIHTAATAALLHAGVPLERAREASPWFFPSTTWMSAALEAAGFEVEKCETEYRPSLLTAEKKDGSGGITGWARLMCAQFLEAAPEEKQEQVLKEICDVIETVITREEDGSRYLGYVRLRAVAKKS
ncbi:related to SAM-dependent methyltransferases [Ramularia collo-cygni]|uniref:Related to SAM-dependent methyltransferases n=1 Tax=Ramularia collo-cygni TaxID=112498 RepID=A0A2D3V3V0_9PEZI|nr:related to SAM-dependent methyltransferases [Ramularia collo-cygni]CZT19357.1 related to SAM-dependent methyltransferases [Ramularia collo-cygni]